VVAARPGARQDQSPDKFGSSDGDPLALALGSSVAADHGSTLE
jgi:hypothetical protein